MPKKSVLEQLPPPVSYSPHSFRWRIPTAHRRESDLEDADSAEENPSKRLSTVYEDPAAVSRQKLLEDAR